MVNAIIDNSTDGIYCDNRTADIINNTIAWNGTGSTGDGIYLSGTNAQYWLYNNIVANNHGAGIRGTTGIYSVLENNDSFGQSQNYLDLGTVPASNISADPRFKTDYTHDIHLQNEGDEEDLSPCIDAGLNDPINIGDQDIDGEARIMDGTVDIGADEVTGCVGNILRLSPKRSIAPAGSIKCITATVNNFIDIPMSGVRVDFNINAGLIVSISRGELTTQQSGYGFTDSNGNVDICITKSSPGDVTITAYVDSCGEESVDTATVTFYDPANPPFVDLAFLVDVTGSTEQHAQTIKDGIRDTVDYLFTQLQLQDRVLRVAGIKFSNNYAPNLLDTSITHSYGVFRDFATLDSSAACDSFCNWIDADWVGGNTEYQLDILMFAKTLAPGATPGLYIALATDEDSDSVPPLTVPSVADALTQAVSIVFIDPTETSLISYYQPLAVNGGAVEQESGNLGSFTFQNMRQMILNSQ